MANAGKIVLLPRARLDLSDDSLSFLKIDEKEKRYFQSLLDKSALEERLTTFYAQQNLVLQAITATRILPVSKAEKIYFSFLKNSKQSVSMQSDQHKKYDSIIFVSKNAGVLARFILPTLFLEQANLFSVGKSCQQFFIEQGFTIKSAEEESAQGLLSLPEFSNIQGKKILICKGAKGLTDLQEQCELRGAQVEVLDLYQREGASHLLLPDIENIAEIYGVSVFSLKHLLEGVSSSKAERLAEIPVLAMSERIANEASLLGFRNISVKKL